MGVIADIHKDLDRSAFRLLVEYHSRLYGEAVKLCGDKVQAEDLVFRTLERVLDRADTYKEDINLFAWMKSIMGNIHKDDQKRPVPRGTKATESDELERCAGADWSTDEQILRNSDGEVVREALRHLDPELKQLVLMRYYDEFSLKEISGILNKPIGTVGRRIQIANRLLAGKLAAKLGKKPLSVLLATFLGIGTLFGVWVSPLGDWVAEKISGSTSAEVAEVEPVSQVQTVTAMRDNIAAGGSGCAVSKAEVTSIAPQTGNTAISDWQKTKNEDNMNIRTKIKKMVASAAVAVAGMASVAFGEMEASLPSAGVRVSTLSQFGFVPQASYINTGVKPTEKTVVEMKVWVGGKYEYWFGCWDNAWNIGAFCFGNDVKGVYAAYNNQGVAVEYGSQRTIPAGVHILRLENGVFTCDGKIVASLSSVPFSLRNDLYLFGQNRAGSFFAGGDIWCDYARIYEGTELVREYLPEYSNGQVSFRETKSDTVVLGPHENKQIVRLAYLDAPKGAYADTGYNKKNDTTLKSGVYPTQATTVEAAVKVCSGHEEWFGCWDSGEYGGWNKGNFCIANDENGTFVGWGAGNGCRSYQPLIPTGEKIIHLGPDFAGYYSPDYATKVDLGFSYSTQAFSEPRTKPLGLCAVNRGGSFSDYARETTIERVRWFKVRENGVLMRNYVAATFDGRVGFFDTVQGDLLTSAGSAQFVAGPGATDEEEGEGGEGGIQYGNLAVSDVTKTSAVVSLAFSGGEIESATLRVMAHGIAKTMEVVPSGGELRITLSGLSPATDYTVVLGESIATFTTEAEVIQSGHEPSYTRTRLKSVNMSSGQYFNTHIVPSDHKIRIVYETTTYTPEASILGTDSQGAWKCLNWTEFTSGGKPVYYLGHHGDIGYEWGNWSGGIHTLVLNEKDGDTYTHRFDDTVIESGADKKASATAQLLIGMRQPNGAYFNGRVYCFEATDNSTGELVAQYVPVRQKSSGEIGFYDTVPRTFVPATGGTVQAGEEGDNGFLPELDEVVFAARQITVQKLTINASLVTVGLELSDGDAGRLTCFCGDTYGGDEPSEWASTVELCSVGCGATNVIGRTFAIPAGTAYIRFGLVMDNGKTLWSTGAATEWIESVVHEEPRTTIPDTSKLLSEYVQRFNAVDSENYKNYYPNAKAEEFLSANVPRFACPDPDIERTYYFRWWTYRKHIRKDAGVWTISEFLPSMGTAGPGNTIVCAAGHHLREGRWLRNPEYMNDYARFWLADARATHRWDYSSWICTGTELLADVTGDYSLPVSLLDDAVAFYERWEEGFQKSPYPADGTTVKMGGDGNGGFVSVDEREGSEMSLSGNGYRPLMNAAMWSEAMAIAGWARRAGRNSLAAAYKQKAAGALAALTDKCWNGDLGFFTTAAADSAKGTIRELHGYAPWYFGVPTGACAADWSQLTDRTGFAAEYGLSFPERRAPGFTIAYTGHECQWNGPSWPFATSIALTALANEIHRDDAVKAAQRGTYLALLRQYAVQHRLTYDPFADEDEIRPWIDEDFDEDKFEWIARRILNNPGVERGKDYNHSTFCDLVISGLVGFTPNGVGSFVVDPVVPDDWAYFALEDVRYHGHDVSVRYERGGAGFTVSLDGTVVFSSAAPCKATVKFKEEDRSRVRYLSDGEISVGLIGSMLTVEVAPGAVSGDGMVKLAWDAADRGDDIESWAHVVELPQGAVSAAGGKWVLNAADLGIPDKAKCCVFVVEPGYVEPDPSETAGYVSATKGQYIDLGIKENEVYGMDFGFAFNEKPKAGTWPSVIAGTLDDFTIGGIQNDATRCYLRYRGAEKFNNTAGFASDQLTNMNSCNAVVISNGEFSVNGVVRGNPDTTQAFGRGSNNLFLFCNANQKSNREANARCFWLKLYGADGGLLADFVPTLENGRACLYDRKTRRSLYPPSGMADLEYGSGLGVVTQVTKAKTVTFRFYNDSALMPKNGFIVFIF